MKFVALFEFDSFYCQVTISWTIEIFWQLSNDSIISGLKKWKGVSNERHVKHELNAYKWINAQQRFTAKASFPTVVGTNSISIGNDQIMIYAYLEFINIIMNINAL